MASPRDYDIVLLGATGYTGKLCAQYIAKHLPTNLRWAVAGRSASKLQLLVDNIREMNADRRPPDVLEVQLNKAELDPLSKRTKVVLNCVGPYHLYSTPVVESCANNGTHYLDVTGETPWVREIIQKFHETAKSNKAIIIPEIGFESAPSDLVVYAAVSEIRKTFNCGTRDVTGSIHEIKGAGFSGGTLATVMTVPDGYSTAEFRAAFTPFSLSPSPPPKRPEARSLLSRIFGPFRHPNLGILTTSISSIINAAIVNRSAGLMPGLYGPNFRYAEYLRRPSYLAGIAFHLAVVFGAILLQLRLVRTVVKKFIYQPGDGPSPESTANDFFEKRAVAEADMPSTAGGGGVRKAMSRIRYQGGIYYLTGVFLAEAAMVLLKEDALVAKLGGGVLTPACLGDKFIERLQNVNVQISAELLTE